MVFAEFKVQTNETTDLRTFIVGEKNCLQISIIFEFNESLRNISCRKAKMLLTGKALSSLDVFNTIMQLASEITATVSFFLHSTVDSRTGRVCRQHELRLKISCYKEQHGCSVLDLAIL